MCRYGGERYEKRELQIRVRQRFAELQSIDEKHGRVPWHVVDASQSIEEVKEKLAAIVTDTIERVQSDSSGSAPLRRMWGEEYEMPDPTTKEGGETTDSSVYSPFLCYFHSSFRYLLHLTQKIVLDTRWV